MPEVRPAELQEEVDGAKTVCDFLRERARLSPDAPALHQPRGDRARRSYETFSWRQYADAVDEIASGLFELGVRKGDVVALDSDSHAEFYLCDLGVMACGAAAAALYPTSPPKEKLRLIERSGAKALISQDVVSLGRLASATTELRLLMRGEAQGAVALAELRAIGRRALDRDPQLIDRLSREIKSEDAAIVYLTSGATGDSKIVVSSHGAVVANTRCALSMIRVEAGDSAFSFLPSAHISQRLVLEMAPLAAGVPVWFAESLNTVAEEIQTVRPTAMVAPPQVWERVRKRIYEAMRRESAWKNRVFDAAITAGIKRSKLEQAGRRVPIWLRGASVVFEKLVYSKLRDRVGGKLRLAISGAAPLAEELAHFWAAVGIRLTEGYGLTEAGILTFNTPGRERFGSVGKALPGVELRLAEDGELLVRSEFAFSGYLNDAETTAEVVRDGWLYTGDIAEIASDGPVRITGRKKEIIISSTGKNVFPNSIEALFRGEPLISNVFLVGDDLPYLAALITLHPPEARILPGMEQFRDLPNSSLGQAPPVQAALDGIVRKVNRRLSTVERILRYKALPRDFSMEKGEVTPTLKLRRQVILKRFEGEVAELYADRKN